MKKCDFELIYKNIVRSLALGIPVRKIKDITYNCRPSKNKRICTSTHQPAHEGVSHIRSLEILIFFLSLASLFMHANSKGVGKIKQSDKFIRLAIAGQEKMRSFPWAFFLKERTDPQKY